MPSKIKEIEEEALRIRMKLLICPHFLERYKYE